MESKPLKQQVALVVDTMGMQGLVEKRLAAERIYAEAPTDYWCLADEREAKIQHIMREVTAYMHAPLADDVKDQILVNVQPELRTAVEKLPRYICISERGGRRAEHVMSWRATKEHWLANFRLKAFVTDRAALSRDDSRDIIDLLENMDANCLADLFTPKAA